LEKWGDLEICHRLFQKEKQLQGLLVKIKKFIERKQVEILKTRDAEIKYWYELLNPAAQVKYKGIVPGTDSLELRAESFSKDMMAAPNLSASQLNSLGLAIYLACATRASTPHGLLLFDDPIQSMDDEHMQSFKITLLKKLLEDGYQVVILTHMVNFANEVEALYRPKYRPPSWRFGDYAVDGPVLRWAGPELNSILKEIEQNKDASNEEYRKLACVKLREFVERFIKELFIAETGSPLPKYYQNKSWSDLKDLLRRCPNFEPADEPVLKNTFDFASQYIHADDTTTVRVPSAGNIVPHFTSMQALANKYSTAKGIIKL